MDGSRRERQKLQVAGFGVGLPLSRLYARYFGGDVHLSQMYGHGTDVLINLNRLGNQTELRVLFRRGGRPEAKRPRRPSERLNPPSSNTA